MGWKRQSPVTSGSFQDIPVPEGAENIPEYYEDVAVVAFRVHAPSPASLSPVLSSSGGEFSLESLTNGRMTDASELPYGPDGAWIQYEFEEPQTICGISMLMAISAGLRRKAAGRYSGSAIR